MNDTEWENRYRSGDTPWDKGEPSPGLLDFLAAHPELPRGRVAVPGCGMGHDVRAWARAGFDACGFDLSESAVRLASEKTVAAGLVARFAQGNFLKDPPPGQFDWVFEHTLYCAIDPAARDDYARAVQAWLKPGGQFLAVHYMIRDTEGPPFGCHQEELTERFGTGAGLELIRGWIPRSYPNRAGRELMLWWRRRSD